MPITEKEIKDIAKAILGRHPRVLEYNMEFFKLAVNAQEGIRLTPEEAKRVAREIVRIGSRV